jgi:signal transduction histidine kinase
VKRGVSLTRRLILTVLLLELLAGLALVVSITVNQRYVQFKIFDAGLRGTADALMGAVQEADDADNVELDLHGIPLGHDAIYRVTDEKGRVLGAAGTPPELSADPETVAQAKVKGKSYRFFVHRGVRIVDPGEHGGIHHTINIVYGAPDGHAWHEVVEAVRFFVIATAVLLGVTALLMVWLMRRWLQPIHDLAFEAERISPVDLRFHAPGSATQLEELRPLAVALQTTLHRLELSFAQQKRFTSDAAHELKTDLAIVKSSLQLLTMKQRTPEEYSRGLAQSLDDFTRLELTVQKMLTLARLEQPAEVSGQTCSLQAALEDAVQGSASFASLRSIRMELIANAVMPVPLDHRDALLLCENILVNALQHSLDGGVVSVVATVVGEHVLLRVRDAGGGIRDEDRPHLFEPFYRGDVSRSRKSGGTGLGLSICKAICDRAGGTIDIANHAEGGAEVTVLLPLRH